MRVEEVYWQSKRICVIASQPHSSILAPNMELVKFDNQFLYRPDFCILFHTVLDNLGLVFQNITRMDLCHDFQLFANGLKPQKFIKKYLNGHYIKTGRQQFKVIGRNGKKLSMDYLRFGSGTSAVSSYMYNKSKELKEAKYKPWIVEQWQGRDFVPDLDVWRLEFSINSSCKDMVLLPTGECISLRDQRIVDSNKLPHLFSILLDRYFKFHHNRGQKVVSRNPVVKLFKTLPQKFKYVHNPSKEGSSRADKVFLKKLSQLNEELRGRDLELSVGCDSVLNYFVESRDAQVWAMKNKVNQPFDRVKALGHI